MRRTKKAISLLLTLAMVLTMIPVITLTFTEKVKAYSSYSQQRSPEYYYASGTQFIYQLVLYYSSSSNGAASDWLSNNGWTDWSGNFNAGDGSSSKYVHSGYKTTTDPTVAIKKVLVADGHPSSLTYGGCTYYAVGGGAITQLPAQGDGCVDLNKGNGGDDLYLMATVDYGAGPALTALTKSQSGNAGTAQNNLTNNGYTIATDQSGNYQDTNAGAGGDYNYVGYKSSCTTVNSSTLRSNYATLLAKYNQISYYNYPSTTKANIESALTTASNILADLNDGYTTSNQTAINNAASACSTQAGYMTVKTPVISRYTWVRDGVAGYYAYAYVDTNGGAPINRVQFPTWTNLNGQDDIQSNWGTNSAASGTSGSWTVNGSTYNYRYYVAVSSHNNEYVGYNTHIYAYNSLGGQTSSGGTFGSFTYPVTYAGGGATGGSTSGQTVNYGEAVNVRTNGFTRAYSVTYDGNGGTAAKTSDTATYTFTGWAGSTSTPGYLINNAGEKSGTGGSSSYTDFAQWGIAAPFLAGEEYTLEFDAYGTGTLINYFYGGSGYLNCAKAVSSNGRTSTGGDGNITASMTSSWTHYKIVWTLGSNGDGNVIKYVLFRASQGTSNVIHAKNIKFYQSKFVNSSKMLNLSTSGTYTMTAQWNSAAVTLPNATRTGYDFNGWYSAASGGTRYGGNGTSYTPTATTAMHAQWTPYTYYVSFNGNGSTSGSMSNQSFTYDTAKALTANGFTRAFTVTYNHLDGRANTTATATATFNGWATSSTGSVAYSNQQSVKNLTSTKNGTFPLYAKWTDGSVTLPTPTRTGYMFGGWYENEGCTGTRYNGGTSYTPSGNKTLYAKWVPNQFNVTFNGNGATSGSMSAQTFTYDVAQNLSANAFSRAYTVTYAGNGGTPSKASDTATATFNGWATSASGAKVYNNQQSVSNLAASGTFPLYANWTLASVTLPSATRSGYQFTGWKASDNGTVYNAGVNYTPTANVTMTAQWSENSYQFRFNGNGATSGTMANQTYTFSESKALSANQFQRKYTVTLKYNDGGDDGHPVATYAFAGWTVNQNGSGTVYADQQVISGFSAVNNNVIDLYAQWTPASVTLPTPYWNAYTFNGWYTDSECTEANKVNGTTFTPTADITLYAKRTANNYTITFDAADGEAVSALGYKTTDTTGLPSTEKAGYRFAGWKVTTADGNWTAGSVVTAGTSVKNKYGSPTLTAQWTPVEYTMILNVDGVQTVDTYTIESEATLPEESKTGYTFQGWKVTANEGNWTETSNLAAGTALAGRYGNVTLAAQWEAETYEISYEIGDGATTAGAPLAVQYDGSYTFTVTLDAAHNQTTPTVTATNATVSQTREGDVVTVTLTDVTGAVEVDVPLTINTYTLTIIGDEGFTCDDTANTTEYGQTLTFTVKLSEGYTQTAPVVTKDGTTLNPTAVNGTDYTYQIADITADVTVSVTAAKNTYAVSVTADDGATVTTDASPVTHGENFSFSVTPKTGYTQTAPAVTVNNETLAAASVVDGTYNYVIAEVKETKAVAIATTINTYAVTFTSDDGADAPAAQTITHGQDCEFTVTLNEGYTQTAPVVTVGSETLEALDNEGNVYTYKIAGVTADKAVAIATAINTYDVTFTSDDGADAPAAQTVDHGATCTFTVTLKTGYTQTAPVVTVDGAALTGTTEDDLTFTYVIEDVTADKAVAITTTLNSYDVTFTSDDGADAPEAQTVDHGEDCTFTVTLNTGYTQTAPVVTVDGATLTYTEKDGDVYTYKITDVTADKAVAIATAINTYDVTFTSDDGAAAPVGQTITHGQDCTFTVVLKTGYTQNAPAVTVDGETLTYTEKDGDVYTYKITGVTADKAVAIATTLNSYAVTFTSDDGADAPEAQTVDHGADASFTVTLKEGYTQTAPVVTVDGVDLEADSAEDNTYSYVIANVTGDKEVAIATAINSYDVTFTADDGADAPAAQAIDHGENCTFTVTLKTGYTQTAPVVTVGSETLAGTTEDDLTFTYVIEDVTADKAVTITTTLNSYDVTFTSDDGADAPAAQTVNHGEDCTFSVTLNEGYTQTAPVVTVDGATLTGTTEDDLTFTYVIEDVTADKAVTIATAINTYDVTFTSDDGADAPAAQTVDHGEDCTFTVTLNTGYTQTAPAVTVDGAALAYTGKDGDTYTFVIEDVTTDKAVAITTTLNSYAVTFTSDDGADAPAAQTIDHGEDCTFTVTLKTGYTQTAPTVAVNCTAIEATSVADNVYTYVILGVTEDKAVTVTTVKNTYGVTFTSDDGADAPAAQTVDHGEDCTFTVTLNTGYTQTAPAVTVDGAALAATGNEGDTYTFVIEDVTADKAVAITTTLNSYDVTFTSDDGADAPAAQTVDHGEDCTFTVTLNEGYTQTAPVVTVDGATLTGTTGDNLTFTYVIEDVTADKAVVIRTTLNTYTITWKNYDGEVLGTDTVNHGVMPQYTGDTPEKDSTDEFSYAFSGWTPEVATATDAAEYVAEFTQTTRTYTVTWLNDDNTRLEKDLGVAYGTMAEYNSETPTKERTAQYTYTFAGWDKEITIVTGDVVYTATYNRTVNSYPVRFFNYDEMLLDSQTLDYGELPVYGGVDPTKPADKQYTYTFKGWDPEVATVTDAADYVAQYDATVNSYTVKFVNGETVLQEETLDYGTMPEYKGDEPTMEATAEFTYNFIGWDKPIATVTDAETYTAMFDNITNSYEVKFVNYNDETLQTEALLYGTLPEYKDDTPTKPADAQYTYTFAGWDKTIGLVTGEVVYKATYTETVNTYTITWVDEDGTELDSQVLPYGATPVYGGEAPTKAFDDAKHYTFAGWGDVGTVVGAATYTAVYTGESHVWNDGTVSIAPTCAALGQKDFVCTVCGAAKSEKLEKNPNNHVGGTELHGYVAPTEEENGYSGDTYCKGCGEMLELGHTLRNLKGYCPYCGGYHEGLIGAIITAVHAIVWLFHKAFRLGSPYGT